MRILLTGASGFLGGYLFPELASHGHRVGTISRSGQPNYLFDLTRRNEVNTAVKDYEPEIIIHAAAMTDVDYCETHPREAYVANVVATKNLVETMSPGTRLVYISTDMVYSGDGPHTEESANPINAYGMTKFIGEIEAQKAPNSLVIRTNFFGAGGRKPSLAEFFIRAFKEKRDVELFTDVKFSPLYIRDAAAFIRSLAMSHETGILNVGSKYGISKSAFAIKLATALNLSLEKAVLGTSKGNARALRPLDMTMNVVRFRNRANVPTIDEGIEKMRLDLTWQN